MTWTTDLVATVQTRLADLGYYRLKVDGEYGPGTSFAMTEFKRLHGLKARDYPGPLTMAWLWSQNAKPAPKPAPKPDEPVWLAEARRLLGTKEVPGAGNNPVIMDWADKLDQWYPGDDTPWCGLFVAHCMAVGAPDEPQDFNRLGAREWLNFGVPSSSPVNGAVAVFWRISPTSWQGHVAIVTGQSTDAVRCIGGNQSDNVTEAWFSKSRVLGYRVPAGYLGPAALRAQRGALSSNEA